MAQKKRGVGFYILIILIIILLTGGYFVYYQYQQIKAVKELKISLAGVNLDQFTFTSVRLNFLVQVSNPNDIDVDVGSFYATISANNIPLAEIALPDALTIPAQKGVQQQFSLRLNYLDIGTVLVNAFQQKEVHWTVQGAYNLQLPFGITIPYTFTIEKELTA